MFGLLKNLLRSIVSEILKEDYPELCIKEVPILKVKRLYNDVIMPKKGSDNAAGYDLHAYMKEGEVIIEPKTRVCIKTGLVISLPDGCYGRVAPRSGLAYKKCVDIAAGVIDIDFRGEVGVILDNQSNEEFKVRNGDRIAQFICEKIFYPEIEELKELDETNRGDGGFGSTGIN
jgi:dUTP pyrophosphatase